MSLTTRLRAAENDSSSSLARRAMRAPDRRRVDLPPEVTAAMSRVLDRECPGYMVNVASAPAVRHSEPLGDEIEGSVPGNAAGASAHKKVASQPALPAAPADRAPDPVPSLPAPAAPPAPAPPEPFPSTAKVECMACHGEVEIVRIDLVQHVLEGACSSCGLETTRTIGDEAVTRMRDLVDTELDAGPDESAPARPRRVFWQLGHRSA